MSKQKQMVVWSSSKTSAEDATKQMLDEQQKMSAKGYHLVSNELVEAGRSKKSWVALGVMNFVRSKQVQMIVTFEKNQS